MKILKCKECGDVREYETSLIDCQKQGCDGIYTVEKSERKFSLTDEQKRKVEDFKVMFSESVYEEAFVCHHCGDENGVGEYTFSTNATGSGKVELETRFECENCKLVIEKKFFDGEVVSGKTRPVRSED